MCCSSVVRFGDIAFLTRVAPCSRQLISFVFFFARAFQCIFELSSYRLTNPTELSLRWELF